jgi:hydrogenase-4 component F
MMILLLGPPVAATLVAWLVRPYRSAVGWIVSALSLVSLAAALTLCARVVGGATVGAADGAFRVDALSALLAAAVSFVAAVAAWFAPGFRDASADPAQARRFAVFSSAFTLSMLGAVTTDNVGLMWIAIEATTITSAVLVPLFPGKRSVEASWKYILICSVGIALAFCGTVLAYFDFVQQVGPVESALSWTVLRGSSRLLHPEVMQLAFVFLLVGYGTKAGLAPMHTWLPDAHAEAPAPLSSMMSGVLLAVATYAILRWKVVVDGAVGAPFTNRLLLLLGVASILIAALSLLAQRNVKRMLAYSSIEHSGLICLGLGLGPAGILGGLLHLVNHAVAKPMLFLLAGRILHRYRTAEIASVSGLLRAMPVTGGLFAAGVLALIGLPPFGLFMSELAILAAGFSARRYGLMALVLALLALAFVGMLQHLNRMLYGAVPADVEVGERDRLRLVPLVVCAALLVALGLTLPAPLEALLSQAAALGGP